MSIDTDGIQEQNLEETQERTQEDLESVNPQAAVFEQLFNGEEEVEETISDLQEDVVEDATTEVEPTTEPVQESVQEEVTEVVAEVEDNRKEWAKELDFNDDLVYEAANFWHGGEKPEWFGDTKQMTDEQREAYQTVQRAKSKYDLEQKQEPEKTTMDQALEIYTKLQELKAQNTPQPAPVVEEVKDNRLEELEKEYLEATQNSEDEKAVKILNKMVEVKTDKKLVEAQKDIDLKIQEQLDRRMTAIQQNQYTDKIQREDVELTEQYGERYLQYVNNGALARVIQATDPLSGQPLVGGDNPVHDAFNYILKVESGGSKLTRNRPVQAAQPPAGATGGEAPGLTQAELDLPFEEYMKLPKVMKQYE